MDEFLKELPALIITLAVLAMAALLIIMAHVAFGDAITVISPAIAFWFLRGAFNWQPSQTQQSQPPPMTPRATATDWSRTSSSTPPPPPVAGQ